MENQSWFLAHNAPAHRSDLFKVNIRTLQHPQYSADLAEADFYPFPLLKSALKGRRFCDVTDIIKNREPTVGSSYTTMLQHTGPFWSRISWLKNSVKILEHPPYCPDLATADVCLFPLLKSALKGRRFCYATDIKNATKELKRLSQKWLSGMFPTTSQALEKVYSHTRGLFQGNAY
jgi:hypothetical protein